MGRSVTTLIGQTVERANGLLWVCVWRVRHLHALCEAEGILSGQECGSGAVDILAGCGSAR